MSTKISAFPSSNLTEYFRVTYRLAVSGVEAGVELLSLLCDRRMKESVTKSIIVTLTRLIFSCVNAIRRMEQLRVVNDEFPVDESLKNVAESISGWISRKIQRKDPRSLEARPLCVMHNGVIYLVFRFGTKLSNAVTCLQKNGYNGRFNRL